MKLSSIFTGALCATAAFGKEVYPLGNPNCKVLEEYQEPIYKNPIKGIFGAYSYTTDQVHLSDIDAFKESHACNAAAHELTHKKQHKQDDNDRIIEEMFRNGFNPNYVANSLMKYFDEQQVKDLNSRINKAHPEVIAMDGEGPQELYAKIVRIAIATMNDVLRYSLRSVGQLDIYHKHLEPLYDQPHIQWDYFKKFCELNGANHLIAKTLIEYEAYLVQALGINTAKIFHDETASAKIWSDISSGYELHFDDLSSGSVTGLGILSANEQEMHTQFGESQIAYQNGKEMLEAIKKKEKLEKQKPSKQKGGAGRSDL